jgi:hypothetical protein
MKAILGVDSQESYQPAISLLAKLAPPKPELLLFHAADITMPWNGIYGEASMQEDYTRAVENIGRNALDKAMDLAGKQGFLPKKRLVFGSPGSSLIYEANNSDVDLVAVNATHRGMWSSTFLGSVSRALAISCPRSVLITKGDRNYNQPLKVVFATDHSEFCNKALDRFISWNLRGIGEVAVVSAFQVSDQHEAIMARGVRPVSATACEYIRDQVEARNQEAVEKLKAAGYNAISSVQRGPTNDVIRHAMQEFGADLLVVGAQGHGFFERILVSSTALHQAIDEPYPVLIVRG